MLTFEFRPSPLMHPEESLDSRDSAWSLRSMWSKMLVKKEVVCGVDSILCSEGTTKCTRVMAVAFTVRTHAVVRKSRAWPGSAAARITRSQTITAYPVKRRDLRFHERNQDRHS